MRFLAVLFVFLGFTAYAAVKVTAQLPTLDGIEYPSAAACEAAAAQNLGVVPRHCVQDTVIEGVCDPKPAPTVYVAPADPTPAVYATPGWNDGVSDKFVDIGNLEGRLCLDGLSYSFAQTEPVLKGYPACWQTEPAPVSECAP